jgi:hypothetical protein
MGKRAEEPLEKKDLNLFAGDWEELESILKPKKISVSVYIRKLIRRNIQQIKSKAADTYRPVPETDEDDNSIESIESDQS